MANTLSHSYTFDKTLPIDEIVEESYERIGIQNVSGYQLKTAKRSLNLLFSEFYGASFGNPIKINDHDAIGRVDVAFLNDQEVLVSYMEGDDVGTYLRIKKVSIDGKVSEPITISKIDSGRNTGVPQLEILNNEIFIVWTVFENEKNQLKTVKLSSKDI